MQRRVASAPRSSAPLYACSSTCLLPLSFAQIILSFVRKQGSRSKSCSALFGNREADHHDSRFREPRLCGPQAGVFLSGSRQPGDPGFRNVRDRPSRSRLGAVGEGHGSARHPRHFAIGVCEGTAGRFCERGSDADRGSAVSRCTSGRGAGLASCEKNRDQPKRSNEGKCRTNPNARVRSRAHKRTHITTTGTGSSPLHQANSRLLGGRYLVASSFEAPRGRPRSSAKT